VPADRDNLARQAAALNRAFAARGPELREAIVRLFRALEPVIEAYRQTAEQLVNSDGFKQLVVFANSAEGQALIAAGGGGGAAQAGPVLVPVRCDPRQLDGHLRRRVGRHRDAGLAAAGPGRRAAVRAVPGGASRAGAALSGAAGWVLPDGHSAGKRQVKSGVPAWRSTGRWFDSGQMGRYRELAEVDLDPYGRPARFRAWHRLYTVSEVVGQRWEALLPVRAGENLGKPIEELRVRHYTVVASGPQRSAVVELVAQGGQWFVEGFAD
jgi:hypothetical protein